VERLGGSDAVKALLLATTANVVEEWDGKSEEIVETSVAKMKGGVLLGKEVDCVARAMMESSAIDFRWVGERRREDWDNNRAWRRGWRDENHWRRMGKSLVK
jgi:hypothetical protein